MSRKHVKQYLMLLLAVGVIAVSLSGGGTFATFNAQVANNANTFVTGTLYLHETASGTCTSESSKANANWNTSGDNLGDTCDVLFSGVSPNGYQSIGLTMKNAGTLDGQGLDLALGTTGNGFPDNGCVSSTDWETVGSVAATNGYVTNGIGPSGAGTHNSVVATDQVTQINLTAALGISLYSGAQFHIGTETFTTTGIVSPSATSIPVVTHTVSTTLNGSAAVKYSPQFSGAGGAICDQLLMSIVEVPSQGDLGSVTIATSTGNTTAPAGSKCVYGGSTNLSNGCDGTNGVPLSSIPLMTSPFDSLTLRSDAGTNPDTVTGLDAGQQRYIVIFVYLSPTADNSAQGQQAAFDLVWNMNQFTS